MLITLGIKQLNPDRVICTMPVDTLSVQPFGLLDGGASVALGETVATFGTVIQYRLIDTCTCRVRN